MIKALTGLGLPHLLSKIKALTDKSVISMSVSGARITYTKQDGTKGIATIAKLPVTNGGTGATSAEEALTSLGAAAADHTHTAASIGAAPASHTHSTATQSAGGMMSATDKAKLDGVAAGANNYVLPTASTTLGGVKTTSTVTDLAEYAPTPIVDGIPYYKKETPKQTVAEMIASTPNYYESPALFTPNKTKITIPKNLKVNIGGKGYISTVDMTIEVSTAGTVAGKDVYIYACQPTSTTSTEPVFILSLNSTVPSGYTATNSRKIGGFHCLCSAAGTLSNINPITGATETHTLSGYAAGNILPASVWDLWHRPQGKQTEGMAYIEPVDIWMGIYGASWDGTKLVHINGGVWADGTSTKKWHGELSLEALIDQGMRLPWRHEFQIAAKGSNEGTNIAGSADPNTTGEHSDTAGRRMISNYGLEDCAGALWQWLMDLGFAGGSGWTESFYNSSVDPRSYGKSYGTTYRLHAGGRWTNGAGCGSRSAGCDLASSIVAAPYGCRGASEPLHRKSETRKAI